ncbi:MAG: hypothetical protein H6513_03915 [Acidimicrobiaceae bacterium]|nr:hypothetical protein [Ilumatobacter sp.]MCB9379822.1 hypothetical protein [Acidimicrobiaceae bacterium]MCO5328945.1 hypothetical protein [Ilumatobacteraceae bacterium]
MRLRVPTTVLAALLLPLAACSSDKASTAGASTTAAPSTTAVPSSTGATPSTDAPSTDAPTTGAPTSAAQTTPYLRSDGLAGSPFGSASADVIARLNSELGTPDSDQLTAYPTNDPTLGWTTADDEYAFTFPFGREVCWSNGFCAEFGGDTSGALTFVGWTYWNDETGSLSTESGATIGSRWSAFPEFSVDPGGCYTVGSGLFEGISLTVQSDMDPFGYFDEDGNYVSQLPQPADVWVMAMQAGDAPFYLYGDC